MSEHYETDDTHTMFTTPDYNSQVTSLYDEFFGHAPDAADLALYEKELKSGKTTEQVRDELSQTTEFKDRLHQANPVLWEQVYGSATTSAVSVNTSAYETQVTSLYDEFFGHAPDAADLALYEKELKSGKTTEQVRDELSQTTEFKDRLHQANPALWEQVYGAHAINDSYSSVEIIGTATITQQSYYA